MKILNNFFKDINKKEAISWAFYDFANSAYTTMIITFIFPIYFKEVIANINGDFWWGLAVSISILLGGFSAPVIGAIADYDTRKKRKFVFFALLSGIGTMLLYFTGPNLLAFSILLFVATNFFFELAQTLYDALLIRVSSKETAGRVSGLGFGLGYIGGVIIMLLLRPLYIGGYSEGLESLYKLTFPLTALFFFIFSLPSFMFIKEEKIPRYKEKLSKLIKIGFSRTIKTIKEVKEHKNIARFLLAFYLLNDALVTLFAFIAIYARGTLQISLSEIMILFIIVQVVAFPATLFFGWLSDKKGQKNILLVSIALWFFVVLGLALATTKTIFYILAIAAGFIIGSSQAIARSWFRNIIPEERGYEFFGFNGFANKIAATLGPIIFGTVSVLSGSQRIAMLTLLPFFFFSFIIFSRINTNYKELNI